MKKWFINRLKTVMEHNDYPKDCMTVENCNTIGNWTPCDLIAREYLNNGGGSAEGFLGLAKEECIRCYDYMKEIKQELIDLHYVNEEAWNNSGITLWANYNF